MKYTNEKKAVEENIYDEHYFRCCNVGADWLDRFIKSKGKVTDPQYQKIISYLDITPGQLVLDIGCGRGEVTAMAGLAGAHAVGIDYSSSALTIAQKLKEAILPHNNISMNYIQSDATILPFQNNTFDRIVMADIVEHLHDWQLTKLYSECWRILRNKGKMVVHTWPNAWHTNYTYPVIARISRLFGSKRPLNPRKPHDEIMHVNEQSPISIKKKLLQTHFQIHRSWCEHKASFSINPSKLAYWLIHRTPGLRLFFADSLWVIVSKGDTC